MVLDFFRGSDAATRRAGNSARRSAHALSVRSEREESHELFVNCVAQVQRNLKASLGSPSALHTLASYYTKIEPYIEGRPFCVSLSYATFLFHLQMARISVADVELYVQLIVNVLGQIHEDAQLHHPFVQQVLRDHVFGLPSPTCRGGAHCVVLVPPPQYRGYATLTTSLLRLDVVPLEMAYQFQDRLEFYCEATSPMVANRALGLLVQCVSQVRLEEQVRALQYVLQTKPTKMNVDFLLACYERLRRAVRDPAHGPTFGRALSIHCSELFLRFHSPVRRAYVEGFLYPSLCHPDMAGFLRLPATRQHLLRELLAQCTPAMAATNPFYLCLCALLQPCLDDEIAGAVEVVGMMNGRMPHAAYFLSTLAVDARMSVAMFAKIVIALARGAGLAMSGRDAADEVAASMGSNRTSVYNVLFTLREVVRSCSTTASRRATDMLAALRVAVAPTTIEALGKLASEAFADEPSSHGAGTLEPQLLCAELAMVLHQVHIEAAMQSALSYLGDATSQCAYCGLHRSASLLCPVNGVPHVTGQGSISRVLATLAECAGSTVVEERLTHYLRDPATQMDGAVHFLVYHTLSNAGQHRQRLFVALEPYIRGTLLALVSADRGTARGLVSSERKASVLMLHVKLAMLLTTSMDPTYLASLIQVFCELKLRTNHDALALWYMGNLLLRHCKGIIDLLPTDPQENRYCVDHPGCAPESAACADNAQLVLRLLDRAHSFSAETRKLVGCCVCKLIQDFNMQAPNLVSTLLSSYGFVPVGLPSLSEFALPVGAGSVFWGFVLHQIRTSAPARTAFMAALAKSVACRFRIATPVDAVSPYGVETTGHVFAVMVYEAVKRNPPLARVLLYMVTQWMRQPGHPPGKFVCLVYVCTQLVTTVLHRGHAPAAVELEAETAQDRDQFDDCVRKAGKALQSQHGRLSKLLPLARRDNAAFFQLVRRLRRRLRHTAAVAQGEQPPPVEDVTEDDDEDNVNDVVGPQEESGRVVGDATLAELQNAADDSVFDDDVDGDDDVVTREDDHPPTPPSIPVAVSHADDDAKKRDEQRRRPVHVTPSTTTPSYSVSRGVQADDDVVVSHEDDPMDDSNTAAAAATMPGRVDRAITAPAERSVGTSPIESGTPSVTKTQLDTPHRTRDACDPTTPSTAVRDSAWHEPDLTSLLLGGDTTPIEDTVPPRLQAAAERGTVLPSGMVLEYLRTHQVMDSLTQEMAQLRQSWMEQQVSGYERHAGAVVVAAMEGRRNNYARPHTQVDDADLVHAPVQLQSTYPLRQGLPREQADAGAVVDGEHALTPVSGTAPKRPRVEAHASPSALPSAMRGMHFFLHHGTAPGAQHAVSALQEVQSARTGAGATATTHAAVGATSHGPVRDALATENLPPATPYGQVVIPACFVEQKNDTAIRELQQVMGAYNPNDSRLSSGAGALLGRGRKARRSGTGRDAERSTTSGPWWTEMSLAPMPEYAVDPQYSMELF